MLAWFRRLFAAPPPPPPRVAELAIRLADVEVELEAVNERLGDALEAVNARITNSMRRQSRQEAPGPTNDGEPASEVPETPGRRPPTLSARFRRF